MDARLFVEASSISRRTGKVLICQIIPDQLHTCWMIEPGKREIDHLEVLNFVLAIPPSEILRHSMYDDFHCLADFALST